MCAVLFIIEYQCMITVYRTVRFTMITYGFVRLKINVHCSVRYRKNVIS